MNIGNFPIKGEHLGIAGITGDGKTLWAVNNAKALNLMDENTAVIFFNYKPKKKDDYDIPGDHIDGNEPKKALKAAVKGKEKIKQNGQEFIIQHGQLLKFRAHQNDNIKNKQLLNLYSLCKEIANETPQKFEIRIFIEEAHEVTPGSKTETDALAKIIKDGRGHGIYAHPISQRMMDLGSGAYTQIEEWVILGISKSQQSWCSQMGFPFDKIYEATNSYLEPEVKDDGTVEYAEGYFQWAHVMGSRVESYQPLPPP